MDLNGDRAPLARADLERRLEELRGELANGERQLRELGVRRDELTATVLRIGGAVQVLEELLAAASEAPAWSSAS